jgi:flagellar protein FlbD
MDTVILLTRLNGQPFALNPDLFERAESTPDTVITLLNGAKYVVAQSLADLVELMCDHRAAVLGRMQDITDTDSAADSHRSATVLRLPERGR